MLIIPKSLLRRKLLSLIFLYLPPIINIQGETPQDFHKFHDVL